MGRFARWAIAFMLLLLAFGSKPARADEGEETLARARAHHEAGMGLYHLGSYREAIKEFAAGYQLVRRPEFLINLGQAYRKLGELERSREMFDRYLAAAPPSAPDRPQVIVLRDEIDVALRERAAPQAVASPAATAGSATVATGSATVTAAQSERRARPARRQVIIGGALAGLGVGAAAVGGALLGLAVSTSDQIEHAPRGTVFDPAKEHQIHVYEGIGGGGLALGGVLIVVGGALAIVGARASRHAGPRAEARR
jgi:tetratricopeptide (TPR) repeat protein